MPVVEIFKFERVASQPEGALPWIRSNYGLFSTQGQVTKTKCTIWPKLELVLDKFERSCDKKAVYPDKLKYGLFLALKGRQV